MDADERYMQEALREARMALEEDEVPIGAVIVCRGRIIGKGHNMTERLHDPTAHAEMIAITAATEALGGKYLNDCTLYVTVEPCPMCSGALNWAQIGRIVRSETRGLPVLPQPAASQDRSTQRSPGQGMYGAGDRILQGEALTVSFGE